jgi:hypothetical protein
MIISRRFVSRAGIAALGVLALAACNNDATSPLTVTPDQLQSMGETIATEIESGALGLTAQGVTSTTAGAPTFSRIPAATAPMFGLAMNRVPGTISRSTTDAACGVASQSPPVDTDGDQVPDNFSISFALPACHFTDASSNSIDMTGVLHISDPQPATPGLALSFGLDRFTLAFSGPSGSGNIMRDGSSSVSLSGGGLSQTSNWTESAQITGYPSITANLNWVGTFVAAQGQSIVAGQPLPDGAFSPSGSVDYREGNRTASFSIATITPLQYSASCAAGVENGTSLAPFTAGTVRVTANGQSVDVTYTNCDAAMVSLAQ